MGKIRLRPFGTYSKALGDQVYTFGVVVANPSLYVGKYVDSDLYFVRHQRELDDKYWVKRKIAELLVSLFFSVQHSLC